MSRRGRKNWSNFETNKRICKQLILHRVWNNLTQTDMSKDIGTTFQQYQKVEKCSNRIYGEQLASICKNRGWSPEVIMMTDSKDTLDEWMIKDYPLQRVGLTSEGRVIPSKYTKIINAWKLLDTNAGKNYYGNVSDPDDISNMKPII